MSSLVIMKEKITPYIHIELDFPPKSNPIAQKMLKIHKSLSSTNPFNPSMKIPTVVLLPTLQKLICKTLICGWI